MANYFFHSQARNFITGVALGYTKVKSKHIVHIIENEWLLEIELTCIPTLIACLMMFCHSANLQLLGVSAKNSNLPVIPSKE